MSSFPAVRSTRKVRTCPALRLLFSSLESSFRMTLFSVTTGDFKMSQTVKLFIVSRLLLHSFLFRSRFFACLSLRFCRCLFRLCLNRSFFSNLNFTHAARIQQAVQFFNRSLRDEQL